MRSLRCFGANNEVRLVLFKTFFTMYYIKIGSSGLPKEEIKSFQADLLVDLYVTDILIERFFLSFLCICIKVLVFIEVI